MPKHPDNSDRARRCFCAAWPRNEVDRLGRRRRTADWWFIHCIALFFLVFGAGFAMTRWHRFFLGEDRDLIVNRLEFQYYVTMTLLVAAAATGILAVVGPLAGSDDF
jgi:ABC-type Fe3+ transport system permease subunit